MIFANEKITVSVSNQSGEPIEYVVISVFAQNLEQHSSVPRNRITVIDQIDKEFIAYVTPIQIGTAIEFPNHDQIRHHVYSFSPAKNFEIPLYKNLPANPVLFENAGVVSLGCNIHDWMSAYIYVVDTPYFAMTDNNGLAVLELPAGKYELRYWHPKVDKESSDSSQMINLEAGLAQNISIQLGLKQTWSLRRGPFSSNNRGRYR
jgi:plastocyanin